MANYIWDLMRARNMNPTFPSVEAYYKGLKVSLLPPAIADLAYKINTFDKV